jgi:cholesterol transport system auxiliary component
MRRQILTTVAVTALAGSLFACSSAQQAGPPIRYFDFGPEPQRSLPKISAVLQVPSVSAPEWLESTTIQYRLGYRDPQTVYTYSTGRWVAPPNSLLTSRLKTALGSGAGVASPTDAIRAGCIVRVALEDFSQTFDSQQSSHVVARARASLVANDGKALISQQVFTADRPTATADLSGAVGALGASGDALVGDISGWLTRMLDTTSPQGQAAVKQCRGA